MKRRGKKRTAKKKRPSQAIDRFCQNCASNKPLKRKIGANQHNACWTCTNSNCGAEWIRDPADGTLVRLVKGFPKKLPCLVCSISRKSIWPGDRSHKECTANRSHNLALEFLLRASGGH